VRRSRYLLPSDIVQRYNQACHSAVVDLLDRGKRSDCQGADPTGIAALTQAMRVRAALKEVVRQKTLTPKLRNSIAALNERADLPCCTSLASLPLAPKGDTVAA